jgi:hypothetical protein
VISVFLLAPRQGKQTVGKPPIYGNAKEKQRYPKCYDQFLNQFFIPGFLFLFTTRVNLVKAILIVVWVLFCPIKVKTITDGQSGRVSERLEVGRFNPPEMRILVWPLTFSIALIGEGAFEFLRLSHRGGRGRETGQDGLLFRPGACDSRACFCPIHP